MQLIIPVIPGELVVTEEAIAFEAYARFNVSLHALPILQDGFIFLATTRIQSGQLDRSRGRALSGSLTAIVPLPSSAARNSTRFVPP